MQMTKIVRTTADLFFPFCLVFGLYVVAHGHLTPGGGFQGGAVMATGTALILVARAAAAHEHELPARNREPSRERRDPTALVRVVELADDEERPAVHRAVRAEIDGEADATCLLYTSPSPRDS